MTEKEFFQQIEQSEQIDIKALANKYLQYWYLFAIGALLGLSAAYIYLRYTTPQYSISSKVLIKDDEKGSSSLGGTAFSELDILQSSKNLDNEIEVLTANSLMQRVLKELALEISYYKPGRIQDVEMYGGELPIRVIVSKINPNAFDKEIKLHIKDNNSFELEERVTEEKIATSIHKFGQQIQKPYGVFTVIAATSYTSAEGLKHIIVKFNNLESLAYSYNNRLSIQPVNKKASVLWISLIDPVREKGKDIINKLIEVYNKEAVEDKNLVAANTIQFIDERLKFLTAELTEVEKNVEQYKRKNELTDVSSEAELYVKSSGEYNQQLSEFEIQIEVLNSIEKYLREKGKQYQLVPSTLNIQDPTLLGLIAKFNELQLERERMLRTTQANNLLVQNINDQLANLQINILENLANIRKGLSITRNNLKASMASFGSKIQKVPSIERDLLEIQRQQGTKQGLYLYLLQKREESAVSLAASVSNSRVLDPAMAANVPVSPKRMTIYLLALAVGLGLPFGILFIRDILNDKVQEKQAIEKSTSTPILGELTFDKTKNSIVVTKENRSSIAEMFRLIRTNLNFATIGEKNNIILVTSSMSGEGKTFFSINLGASLALTGKNVVILEFDLRKPNILQALNLNTTKEGITNYLISDEIKVDDIVIPVPSVQNLYICGCGPIPPNPAELMLSPKVKQLLQILKESFDHIIIDTSPIGQVSDAFALAPYIDSSIYIIRYDYTYLSQLDIIKDIYSNKKLKYPMIVLNASKKIKSYGYGSYYQKESGIKATKKKV